jgi:hypothetical protein
LNNSSLIFIFSPFHHPSTLHPHSPQTAEKLFPSSISDEQRNKKKEKKEKGGRGKGSMRTNKKKVEELNFGIFYLFVMFISFLFVIHKPIRNCFPPKIQWNENCKINKDGASGAKHLGKISN